MAEVHIMGHKARAQNDGRPMPDRLILADQSGHAAPHRHELADLLQRMTHIRAQVAEKGAVTLGLWNDAIRDEAFRPAAENLAHYLALRHHDVSDLQPRLAAFGLSSLGRSEGHVMASLDALIATLSRLSGTPDSPYPSRTAFDAGTVDLRRIEERLFGVAHQAPHTRIMVTLPREAGSDPDYVRRLIAAGMGCARINCAHDSPDIWLAMIGNVGSAAAACGHECRILMDIAGPKCRIETVHATQKVRLHRGDRLVLVKDMSRAQASDAIIATISFPAIIDELVAGAEIWINDGKIGTHVVANRDGRAILEVIGARAKGERLKPEKGLNFPSTELRLPPLTADDLAALDFVAEHADLVGFSFVQRPSDIVLLERELAARRGTRERQPIVLKIETPLAVKNLPQLIVQCAGTRPLGVMIARGDLAVELGFARLSEIQEEILWLCEAAHVPVIWATQVLDGLVSNGLPSRAETTDAAMSQRAECVMLNKGPFLLEAIAFLEDVLARMDRHQRKKSARFGPLHSWRELAIPRDPAEGGAPPQG
jgi:pyruvate kinase